MGCRRKWRRAGSRRERMLLRASSAVKRGTDGAHSWLGHEDKDEEGARLDPGELSMASDGNGIASFQRSEPCRKRGAWFLVDTRRGGQAVRPAAGAYECIHTEHANVLGPIGEEGDGERERIHSRYQVLRLLPALLKVGRELLSAMPRRPPSSPIRGPHKGRRPRWRRQPGCTKPSGGGSANQACQ